MYFSYGDIDRFWSLVAVAGDNECWIWKLAVGSRGYGKITMHGKTRNAHRIAYEIWHGGIDAKRFVLHTCDNRMCVNPNHLYQGSHEDNMRDRCERSRTARGASHGMSKISDDDVRRIFEMRVDMMSQPKIAVAIGISNQMVSRILAKRAWRHLHMTEE